MKYGLHIIFLLVSFNSFGQIDLFAVYNSTHSGINYTFSLSKRINNNEYGLGVRYNVNRMRHPDNENNVYLKRQYATKPIQHWGAELFYHRYILSSFENIQPFIFYDNQLSYSTTRAKSFIAVGEDQDGNLLYRSFIDYHGAFTWVEQNIGIGFKAQLKNNWFLTQKIGVGTSFIIGQDTYDSSILILKRNLEWEFGYLVQVGLIYRLQNEN